MRECITPWNPRNSGIVKHDWRELAYQLKEFHSVNLNGGGVYKWFAHVNCWKRGNGFLKSEFQIRLLSDSHLAQASLFIATLIKQDEKRF